MGVGGIVQSTRAQVVYTCPSGLNLDSSDNTCKCPSPNTQIYYNNSCTDAHIEYKLKYSYPLGDTNTFETDWINDQTDRSTIPIDTYHRIWSIKIKVVSALSIGIKYRSLTNTVTKEPSVAFGPSPINDLYGICGNCYNFNSYSIAGNTVWSNFSDWAQNGNPPPVYGLYYHEGLGYWFYVDGASLNGIEAELINPPSGVNIRYRILPIYSDSYHGITPYATNWTNWTSNGITLRSNYNYAGDYNTPYLISDANIKDLNIEFVPYSIPATASASSFDFSLSNGGNRYITAGGTVTNNIDTTLVTGTAAPVKLFISSITNSSGVNVFNQANGISTTSNSLSVNPVTPTQSSDLTLTASASVPAGTYTVSVSGVNSSNLSHSTSYTVTVDPYGLAVADGATSNCTTGSISLTWNKVSGIDHYKIYRAVGAGAESVLSSSIAQPSGSTATYTDGSLASGAYTYRVEGILANGTVSGSSQPQTWLATPDSSKCLSCNSLTVSPNTINSNQSATLTWSSSNASSCTLSDGNTISTLTSGSMTVNPGSSKTYTLSCTNASSVPNQCTLNTNLTVTNNNSNVLPLWLNGDTNTSSITVRPGQNFGINWKASGNIQNLVSGSCIGVTRDSNGNSKAVSNWSSNDPDNMISLPDDHDSLALNTSLDTKGTYTLRLSCDRDNGTSLDTINSNEVKVRVVQPIIQEK